MEIKKSIQLTTEPLEELIKKGESLDFRLDQDAWKELHAGDYIEFWEDFTGWQTEPTESSRKVIAKIIHIYWAATFKEIFELIEQDSARLENEEELLGNLHDWWSEEKEMHEGVLALHVVVPKTVEG